MHQPTKHSGKSPTSLYKITILRGFEFSNYYLIMFNQTFKGPLLGLRQFLATESPLKTIKSAFYFTFKAVFVFKIEKRFAPEKRFDKKTKVNFKIYGVAN